MAVTAISKTVVPLNTGTAIAAAVACGADGAVIDYSDQPDGKILLLIGTAEATIQAGDGFQSKGVNLVVPFETGKTKAVVIESGRYMQTSGANKGKILITGATATVQAIALP